jgi:hypothetical protein
MWVDAGAEARTRMRDRVQEADRERLATQARPGRAGPGPAGRWPPTDGGCGRRPGSG